MCALKAFPPFHLLSMILSHEIAELQRIDPGARIVVLSDQNQLGVENDYAFWYDYTTVEVFVSAASARGRKGYLMSFTTSCSDACFRRSCSTGWM